MQFADLKIWGLWSFGGTGASELDHVRLRAAHERLPLSGPWNVLEITERLDCVVLVPVFPRYPGISAIYSPRPKFR